MKTCVAILGLLLLVTMLTASQEKSAANRSVALPKNAARLSASEHEAFNKKLATFRGTLTPNEQRFLDALLPHTSGGGQPEAAHQPGDRDSVGATKVNGKQIREADGSTVTCPEGTSVQAVPNGNGNFNWLCVTNGA